MVGRELESHNSRHSVGSTREDSAELARGSNVMRQIQAVSCRVHDQADRPDVTAVAEPKIHKDGGLA
jgi:hypothetical protein